MRKFTKFLASVILGTLMLGTTVFAAEEPIVMYTNATAELYTAPEADASKILIGATQLDDGLPIFVTNFTQNGFYAVDLGAGVDYYIPMVSMNMTREDALAADAFDKALADAMAVLASGELGNVNLLGEANNPSVNVPAQSQAQTPTQSVVTSNNPADVLPAEVVNATVKYYDEKKNMYDYSYVKLIPEGVTMDMLPHAYGTYAYEQNGSRTFVIDNSNTDPCSVYLDDTNQTLMARMETAHILGYRYVITECNNNVVFNTFGAKYGCTVEWADDIKTTMTYTDPRNPVDGCQTQPITFALYTW